MKIKTLITGIGGDIGQSINRILKSKPELFESPIGTDIHDRHAGKFEFDHFKIIPRVDDEKYLQSLEELIKEFDVEFIIPSSEIEIDYFNRNSIPKIGNSQVLIANRKSIEIGFNKYETSQFLKENNLPFIQTDLIAHVTHISEPKILKPISGSGSKNIHIIRNDEELHFFKNQRSDFIVQTFIPGGNNEYTCGLFRDKHDNIRSIIFKRELKDGVTVFGEVVQNDEIQHLLERIARTLELSGSINVQLKLMDNIPYVFEINPRFSSTVFFRHQLGFEDVIWSIQNLKDIPINFENKISKGKIYRNYNDIVEIYD